MEKYVQPFIDTSLKVFKEFLNTEIIADTPYFINRTDKTEWSISGIIGLTGEAVGAVVLSMKTDLALEFTKKLTGEDVTEVNDDVIDTIGEIVNIIAGNVKKELEEMFKLIISLPTIVQGESHSTFWANPNSTRAICLPFSINRCSTRIKYGKQKINKVWRSI